MIRAAVSFVLLTVVFSFPFPDERNVRYNLDEKFEKAAMDPFSEGWNGYMAGYNAARKKMEKINRETMENPIAYPPSPPIRNRELLREQIFKRTELNTPSHHIPNPPIRPKFSFSPPQPPPVPVYVDRDFPARTPRVVEQDYEYDDYDDLGYGPSPQSELPTLRDRAIADSFGRAGQFSRREAQDSLARTAGGLIGRGISKSTPFSQIPLVGSALDETGAVLGEEIGVGLSDTIGRAGDLALIPLEDGYEFSVDLGKEAFKLVGQNVLGRCTEGNKDVVKIVEIWGHTLLNALSPGFDGKTTKERYNLPDEGFEGKCKRDIHDGEPTQEDLKEFLEISRQFVTRDGRTLLGIIQARG